MKPHQSKKEGRKEGGTERREEKRNFRFLKATKSN